MILKSILIYLLADHYMYIRFIRVFDLFCMK